MNYPHALITLLNIIFKVDPRKIRETSEFPLNYYLLFIVIGIITAVVINKRKNQNNN